MGIFWKRPQPKESMRRLEIPPHGEPFPARIEKLEQQVERLSLLSEALWQVVREQHGIPDEDLLGWVEAVQAGRHEPTGAAPGDIVAPLGELYGPPPPPPIVTCTNCNTRFQEIDNLCPNCGCMAAVG
jgi:hypothetical protein